MSAIKNRIKKFFSRLDGWQKVCFNGFLIGIALSAILVIANWAEFRTVAPLRPSHHHEQARIQEQLRTEQDTLSQSQLDRLESRLESLQAMTAARQELLVAERAARQEALTVAQQNLREQRDGASDRALARLQNEVARAQTNLSAARTFGEMPMVSRVYMFLLPVIFIIPGLLVLAKDKVYSKLPEKVRPVVTGLVIGLILFAHGHIFSWGSAFDRARLLVNLLPLIFVVLGVLFIPANKGYEKLPIRHKRAFWGLVFLLPWILGFALFFARPFADTVRYSFSEVETGLAGVSTEWIGWENFYTAFNVNPHFQIYMMRLAWPALAQAFIVVVFSLFAAMLINGKYFGRGIVRAVFFVPIIMGANIASAAIAGQDAVTQETTGVAFGGISTDFFMMTLFATGLPPALTGFVSQAVQEIFGVLAQSGVPILIFLAGLQAIPPSLYEVAHIEGSTKYETFWKVTLPMISPMVLLSAVYTITDLFSRHAIEGVWIARVAAAPGGGVGLMEFIRDIGFTNHNVGLASAMAITYVVACLLVITLITFVLSKVVFYYE